MTKKPKKLKPLKTLRNKAWSLMSEYSRLKDSNRDGMVKCVTCETVKHWKEMHAGHFFHGSKQRPISYDDRNIHAQCSGCNLYGGGKRDHYSVYVIRRYGSMAPEELRTLKLSGKEMRRIDLEEMIALQEARLSL